MATREAYARGWIEIDDKEVSVGIELRPGDDVISMSMYARELGRSALRIQRGDHERTVMQVEAAIKARYPDRAYFIETEQFGCGVQVYQPWGMPRTNKEAT